MIKYLQHLLQVIVAAYSSEQDSNYVHFFNSILSVAYFFNLIFYWVSKNNYTEYNIFYSYMWHLYTLYSNIK